MDKLLSVGTIITDDIVFLVGHATKMTHWDIPKGEREPEEALVHCALREVAEETNLHLPILKMWPIGYFKYRPQKDLFLFKYKVQSDSLPPLGMMKCNSFVNDDSTYPEFDQYKYIRFDEVGSHLSKTLQKVFKQL